MSEQVPVAAEGIGAGSHLIPVTEGEWAGWASWEDDPFEDLVGPYYQKQEPDGAMVLAFRAEARHMNGGGFMHGGKIMTFADSALFTIARSEMAGSHGVTIHLSGDFLNPVKVGALVEARGEVTRGGGKTVFVRGMVTADGTPALSFTGIIRKVGQRA